MKEKEKPYKMVGIEENHAYVFDAAQKRIRIVQNKDGNLSCSCPKKHNCAHEGYVLGQPEIELAWISVKSY